MEQNNKTNNIGNPVHSGFDFGFWVLGGWWGTKCEHLRGIVRAQYAVSTFSKKLRFGLLRFKFVKPGIRTQLLGSLHSDT